MDHPRSMISTTKPSARVGRWDGWVHRRILVCSPSFYQCALHLSRRWCQRSGREGDTRPPPPAVGLPGRARWGRGGEDGHPIVPPDRDYKTNKQPAIWSIYITFIARLTPYSFVIAYMWRHRNTVGFRFWMQTPTQTLSHINTHFTKMRRFFLFALKISGFLLQSAFPDFFGFLVSNQLGGGPVRLILPMFGGWANCRMGCDRSKTPSPSSPRSLPESLLRPQASHPLGGGGCCPVHQLTWIQPAAFFLARKPPPPSTSIWSGKVTWGQYGDHPTQQPFWPPQVGPPPPERRSLTKALFSATHGRIVGMVMGGS